MSSAPRIYCKSCGNCAPVHSLTCPERKPVKRMTEEREDPAEEETTPDEVREAVEMAWTDATHLPPSREQGELCSHLRQATEILDGILESQKKSPEQRLLDRITKDFGIEGDEDAYETAKRLEAAATRLAAEKNDFRKQAEEAADEAAKLGAALAERDDDFRLGMKIANEVTPETQSCEEACADLVRLVREARKARDDAEERIRELEGALKDSMSQCGEQCLSHDGYRCDCGSDEHNNRITAALSRKGTP